tara:strand:- start:3 stop:203 length:201 start_codon:yes stop_codon:yes gene_type:complete
MVFTLEQIDKRLAEIPQQVAVIQAEQNQLLGYKQALTDAETEATPKNGEVIPPPQKEKKSKVGKGV